MTGHRTVTGLIFLALFVFCVPAAAKSDPNIADKRHTFEIGPEVSWITYKEPGLMKEEGVMYGVGGSYIYRGPLFSSKVPDSWMLRADGRYSVGEVDYDGHLQPSGTPYSMSNVDDYIWELRGLFGYDFKNDTARTTAYTGFGYRYLNDDSSGDPAGYERESNYFYIPIGVDVLLFSEGQWSLGGIMEFDYLAYGEQRSHLEDVEGYEDYGVLKNKQHNGWGFRASVRLKEQKQGVCFGVEPFVRYWNIRNSKVTEDFIEPENRSIETGIRLVWTF
jgi:hypothetical protein